MRNKTISLNEETFEKLKEEENASGLINDLLRKHYESSMFFNTPDKYKIEVLEREKEQCEVQREKAEKMIDKLKEEVKTKEEKEQEKLNKEVSKEVGFRNNFFNNYKELTGVEANEPQFIKYKLAWDKSKEKQQGYSIYNFIEEEKNEP